MDFKLTPLLRCLPAALQSKINNSPTLQRVLENTGWLMAERVVRLGAGLLVSVWLARYLGPEQFGLLSYATAFVALFAAIGSLGLNGVVVRDLVREQGAASLILGTTCFLQFLAGILAFGLIVGSIGVARPEDHLTQLLVVVMGCSFLFKTTDTVKYWFESQVQSKYCVWVENAVFLTFVCVKIILILGRAPLLAFAWVVLGEAVLTALALLFIYHRRGGRLKSWSVKMDRAKGMLSDCWPLVLSGVAIMIYMRIDQVMLGQLMNDEAVGLYSAAVRISEAWYFVPVAIVSSVFPSIVAAKKKNEILYYQRLQKLYDLMVLTAVGIAVPLSFFSEQLIALCFGPSYHQAGAVLAIHAWGGVFVFLGVACNQWFLVENLQKFSLFRAVAGALLNVGLNLWLIPIYGVLGAVWATVVSQAMASVFLNVVSKKIRIVFVMQLRSLAGVGILSRLKSTG